MTARRYGGIVRSPAMRVAVLVVVVGAWGWFLWGQLEALSAYQWRIGVLPLSLAVVCGAVYFVGLALAWTLLLRSMGGAARAVAPAAGAQVWTGTMLSRYIPGNIWHIVGRVAFAERLGVGRGQVLASATVEQLLTLLGALAVFGLSLPFQRGEAGNYGWLLLLLPVGLGLLHPRIFGALLAWLATRLRRPELVWTYSYRELLLVNGAFLLAKIVSGLALLAVVAALAPLDAAGAAFVLGASGLAWAVGYLSLLTPSGLGVREATLTALLAQLFPLPVAVVASLVYRLALTLGELVAAGALLLYVRLRPPAPIDQEQAAPVEPLR